MINITNKNKVIITKENFLVLEVLRHRSSLLVVKLLDQLLLK